MQSRGLVGTDAVRFQFTRHDVLDFFLNDGLHDLAHVVLVAKFFRSPLVVMRSTRKASVTPTSLSVVSFPAAIDRQCTIRLTETCLPCLSL